jgi:dihydrofolate reductase
MEHQPADIAPEIFIIGGGDIYAQALPLAQRMVLTEVKRDFDADVFFPAFDKTQWQEISREPNHDETTGLDYDFVNYHRLNLN